MKRAQVFLFDYVISLLVFILVIVAGIKSGGELGDLLARIAENIRETQLMQKEIAASVMTYVIFISAATVVASPVLFALSRQMLVIITSLLGSFTSDVSTGAFSLSFGEGGVSFADFTIFTIVMIGISCFFAAGIVSTIRKGNAHDQLRYFPIFYLIALVTFFAASYLLGMLFGGFF